MKYVLTIVSILCCWTSYAQVDSVDIWISRINNSQLQGTCHYAWTIEVDKNATEVFKLINAGKSVTNKLINNLTDTKRGVICHFILSTL